MNGIHRQIVPVVSKPGDTGRLLDEIRPFLPSHDAAVVESMVDGCFVMDPASFEPLPDDEPPLADEVDEAVLDAALAERDRWESKRAETVKDARDELQVHPASGDEGDHPVPASLLGADDAPLIVGDGPPAEKGEAMHKVLELIDLRDPGDVEGVTRSVCALGGIAEHADEVLSLVNACLASPVVTRARRAERLWCEVPYTLRVKDGYATGRIDLVFEENGALVVVDWKSDTVAPSAVAAALQSHREQGEAYVRAVKAATRSEVNEVVFVFPRSGREGTMVK